MGMADAIRVGADDDALDSACLKGMEATRFVVRWAAGDVLPVDEARRTALGLGGNATSIEGADVTCVMPDETCVVDGDVAGDATCVPAAGASCVVDGNMALDSSCVVASSATPVVAGAAAGATTCGAAGRSAGTVDGDAGGDASSLVAPAGSPPVSGNVAGDNCSVAVADVAGDAAVVADAGSCFCAPRLARHGKCPSRHGALAPRQLTRNPLAVAAVRSHAPLHTALRIHSKL
ncbi:circumsporozoite protein-like [Schistocerca gregaria]|uniref:circumsporozoite protein-like n=1 Tax=Schistocerca gregaria TaxID=7010 RepID=UPI00211DF196|nr:circumsporozoite protein-like [Schistocerca gregaria]